MSLKEKEQAENLESFTKQVKLITNNRIDHAAQNSQASRAAELRELIQLEQEEFFNVFELLPQNS